MNIEKVAVIGAGVMGASIAAHISNAGIPVTLRRPRGQDIDAACGQLRLRNEKI